MSLLLLGFLGKVQEFVFNRVFEGFPGSFDDVIRGSYGTPNFLSIRRFDLDADGQEVCFTVASTS